jgi:hypothetical protein
MSSSARLYALRLKRTADLTAEVSFTCYGTVAKDRRFQTSLKTLMVRFSVEVKFIIGFKLIYIHGTSKCLRVLKKKKN